MWLHSSPTPISVLLNKYLLRVFDAQDTKIGNWGIQVSQGSACPQRAFRILRDKLKKGIH